MKRFLFLPFLFLGLFLSKPAHAIENDVYKYSTFSSSTTISILPVKLHSITLTGTAAVAFFVYDSTSTTASSQVVISSFTASTAAGTYLYDIQTQNGLTVVVGAASPPNITVNYR